MQLSYRGITYGNQSPIVEATETGQLGTFLGQPFPIKHFNLDHRHSTATVLKYRGIYYIR